MFKLAAITLLAFVALAASSPVQISDNNVGDIVTVGVNANANLSNHVEQNIISIIVALLNQQGIAVGLPGRDGAEANNDVPKLQITPEMIETVKNLLTEKH